jgi:type IV secretion system protein VirB9
MKKTILIATAITAIFLISANGASIPKGSQRDSRMTYQDYHADEVVKLYAKDGFITVIKLRSDERIIDMFTGFADGWDIQDRANFVFVKPKAFVNKGEQSSIVFPKNPEWNTNLFLTTNQRVYAFDLVLVEKQQPVYRVDFEYTADVKKQQEQQKEEQKIVEKYYEEVNYVKDKLTNLNNPRNWDFYMRVNPESDDISPVFAYDDGIFTYLGYDNTKSVPSVFLYEKNAESILNTHMKEQGEYQILVIHKVAPSIILRAGEKVVGIFNRGFGINHAPSGTTISKDVQRVIK